MHVAQPLCFLKPLLYSKTKIFCICSASFVILVILLFPLFTMICGGMMQHRVSELLAGYKVVQLTPSLTLDISIIRSKYPLVTYCLQNYIEGTRRLPTIFET